MITIQNTFDAEGSYPLARLGDPASLLFFDIETTGFSGDFCTVYLIGCVFYKEGRAHFIQWFADTKASEAQVIQSFFSFLKDYSVLVHFNGDTFDIPFLMKRCRALKLPCDFSGVESVDIYKRIKPWKKHLGLENLKQKTIEGFLSICREDRFDGGQLISVYEDYLKTRDENLLRLLLLHNEEDLLGMKYLLPLFSYRMLLSKDLSLIKVSPGESLFEKGTGSIAISCKLPLALPKPLNFSTSIGSISTDKNDSSILIISLPYIEETLKHFFKDYRNYYYLPEEDRAVHKSVGCYVERKYRRAAKASTCYIKKEGIFLPIPKTQKHYGIQIKRYPYQDSFPLYKREFKSPRSFAEFDNLFSDKNESLSIYLRDVIKELFIIHIQEINDLI